MLSANSMPVADNDGDGLSDHRESELGTNPLLTDSDYDGLSDREEVDAGRDPNVNEGAVISIINSILSDD